MSNQEDQVESITTETQQEQKINLSLTVNEINIFLAAVQELPHKVADPLIRNIMSQAQSQVQ